jgi:L-ascorbate metabolism protein UlaG (beta-lactamase superfamily)
MAAIFGAQACRQAPAHPSDTITTRDGGELVITFFGHGSIAFEYGGRHVYIDPVGDYADYSALPKADLVLVGHEHGDHLDAKAIGSLRKEGTAGFGNRTAAEAWGSGEIMAHGDVRDLGWVTVEAFPAYNTSPEKQNFHPAARAHNGWILAFGGTRVYVAGDTEDTPEMMALGARRDEGHGIDIAFLPVNLPYTMTEGQAARAVRAIGPRIFYPYHYGGTDHRTDLGRLARLIEGSGVEMRVRPLE